MGLAAKVLPKLKAAGQSLRTGGRGPRGAATVGAFGLGALAGSGSSPDSSVSGNNVSFGTAGAAARSGMSGGGSLPSIRAASKPSVNQNMNVNQLLVVAIGYLASIDQTLKNRLETTRSIFTQQQMVSREAGVEAQETRAFFGGPLSQKFASGTNNLIQDILPGIALAASGMIDSLGKEDPSRPGQTMGRTILNFVGYGLTGAFAATFLTRRLVRIRATRAAMSQARAAHRSRMQQRMAVRSSQINQRAATMNLTNAQVRARLNDPTVQQSLRNQGYTQRRNGKWELNGRVASNSELRTAVTRSVATAEVRAGARIAEGATVKGTAAAARTAGRVAASKIPLGIGTIISFGFAADFVSRGEYGKAALTALGGLASFIPIVGTGVSLAIDAAVVGWDIYDANNPPPPPDDALTRNRIPRDVDVRPQNTPGSNVGPSTGGGIIAPAGMSFANVPFSSVKNLIRRGEGTARETGYNMPYAGGQFLQPSKPLTEMTLAEVQEFQTRQISATANNPRANVSRGTGAVGAYQFNKGTLTEISPRVFGENWRSVRFTPENQDKLAEYLYNERRGSNTQLAPTWAYFSELSSSGAELANQASGRRREVVAPRLEPTPEPVQQDNSNQVSSLSPNITNVPADRNVQLAESVPLPVFYDERAFKRTVLHAYA